MKQFFFLSVTIVFFFSCHRKQWAEKILEKGYGSFVDKDTLIVKPYEYFQHRAGYYPGVRECAVNSPLNVKFSIKGYENTDTIPLRVLFDSLSLSLSDTSIKEIVSGQLLLMFSNASWVYNFRNNNIDNKIKFFSSKRPKAAALEKSYAFFNFCVTVMKDGQVYTIPSRKYVIKI